MSITAFISLKLFPLTLIFFFEEDTFSFYNERISKKTVFAIFDHLKLSNETFESVAETFHLTRQEIIYLFDKYVDYTPPSSLPIIMS